MSKFKILIYLFLFLIANNIDAQVDSVTFRFVPDISTYNIRCQAQKMKFETADTILTDFTIQDTVNSDYTFTWSGDVAPNANGVPATLYEFGAPGIYSFTLSVVEKSTSKTYTVTRNFDIRDIIRVPNVFTPNFDGVNDLFIVNSNGLRTLEISVFSRSGTLVYESKAPIIVWDGRNQAGKIVSQGVYYYILTTDDPAIEAMKGFIHVFYDDEDIKD